MTGTTKNRTPNRLFTAAAVAAASLIACTVPAAAHTPVEITSAAVRPWQGPLILDGQNPVMLFGTLPHPGSLRGAQLHMTAGQQLSVALAIPDKAPENQLATDRLPKVVVVAPGGKVTVVQVTVRIPITTESGQNLLVLGNTTAVALTGDYSIAVVGAAAERFALATGVEGDEPFIGVARGTVATDAAVAAWYATPPQSAHR
ncbi:hypothetical protein [Streptomyces sp. NPDC005374]|uniref:hypothetical protein n=1 Tax=Streptomyces sp. NPDC005374 TaxID=3364713 RepID=UPI00368C1684